MSLTNYPFGLSSFGVPVLGGGVDPIVGNVFFVGSTRTGAADSLDRGALDNPYATINYASTKCTANNGDVIYVLPGHVETITAAAGLAMAKAGVTVIGLGRGAAQPQIKIGGAATADVDIDAASVTFQNVNFVANVADITAAIDVNATDFTLRACRFTQAAVDLNAKIWVQDAAAAGSDRITIEYCHAVAYDAANTHFVNFAGTGTGHLIRNNVLIGDWGTACVGGAGVVTYATVIDNLIYNAATDNDACINFAATATGIVARNLVGGGAAQANGITATAMAINQNYYGVNSEDLSGILEPIAT